LSPYLGFAQNMGMKKFLLVLITGLVCAPLATAWAQVDVQISFGTPPPLVEVEPGIQVVPEYGEEVFFVDGWYWHRSGAGLWYRSRDHRGGWVMVDRGRVPGRLYRIPPGHYKHWHRGGERQMARNERRGERAERAERHEERREERREVRREERREEHREAKHHGR
jgi:hypothetical protein